MATTFRFASVGNSQVGYEFSTDTYREGGNYSFWKNASQFHTYGDGMTQHSPTYAVQISEAADYLMSLWSHCEGNPEHWNVVCDYWPYAEYGNQLRFLVGLRPNKGKSTWINLDDCKKSFNRDKQFDTRWQELPEAFNGHRVEDLYQMIRPSWLNEPVRAWMLHRECKLFLETHDATYFGQTILWLYESWNMTRDEGDLLDRILCAFTEKRAAWKHDRNARRYFENAEQFRISLKEAKDKKAA